MALLSVADALAQVLQDAAPLPPEDLPLAEAHGRVLAADLAATRTQPPAALSAMDGYAVRGADVATAPARLKLIGEVAAGHPFAQTVGAGEAARIFTGGVMPPGTDTVVIQENTAREGEIVVIHQASAAGRHVRKAGLDFTEGEVLLASGRRITARDLALAAAMNHPVLPVHRKPRVAMLATGDELVPPGTTPGLGEIVYSNGFAIMAMARGEGAETVDLGIAPDRVPETIAAIRRARDSGADILVTSGGASVGEYDLVQRALAAEGMALSFWRIAMRPGRPMMHGRLGAMHVLGLPGNPVSAYACAFLFLTPLIRRLTGRADVIREPEHAVLGAGLPVNDERADYLRGSLVPSPDGLPIATAFPLQDSSMLTPLALADCLILRAPYARAAQAGDACEVFHLGV